MTPISRCSQVSRRFRHQLHLLLSDTLCTPFAEATSCVVGLSTSIRWSTSWKRCNQEMGRWASQNSPRIMVHWKCSTSKTIVFFCFWTDHFPLNHDLWDGREGESNNRLLHLICGRSPWDWGMAFSTKTIVGDWHVIPRSAWSRMFSLAAVRLIHRSWLSTIVLFFKMCVYCILLVFPLYECFQK